MKIKNRKKLTRFLKECWHDKESRYKTHTTGGGWAYAHIEQHYAPRCSKCGKKNPKNRTFTKWEDFGALWDKIGFNMEFEKWLFKWFMLDNLVGSIMDKKRFPELVLEAIKEGVLNE